MRRLIGVACCHWTTPAALAYYHGVRHHRPQAHERKHVRVTSYGDVSTHSTSSRGVEASFVENGFDGGSTTRHRRDLEEARGIDEEDTRPHSITDASPRPVHERREGLRRQSRTRGGSRRSMRDEEEDLGGATTLRTAYAEPSFSEHENREGEDPHHRRWVRKQSGLGGDYRDDEEDEKRATYYQDVDAEHRRPHRQYTRFRSGHGGEFEEGRATGFVENYRAQESESFNNTLPSFGAANCTGYDAKDDCNNANGCEWFKGTCSAQLMNSTKGGSGGDVYDLDGDVVCSNLDNAATCGKSVGQCTWRGGDCNANCRTFHTETGCKKNKECIWEGSHAKCVGEATEKKMATGDSVLPDSITDPNANQNNMTAGSGAAINLDTYCILYPDETFLCPNDKQRRRLGEHLKRRNTMKTFLIAGVIAFLFFFSAGMSVYRGFVETGRSFRVEVYELANRQTCLLLCVFAAATILSHYDAIKKIHALYFGPTADRLDLSNRAVGDLREGKLISETGALLSDTILVLVAMIPAYALIVMLTAGSLTSTIAMWKGWEMYLREIMLQVTSQIFTVSKAGLLVILFVTVSRFQFLAESAGPPLTSMGICLACAIILFVLGGQVKGIIDNVLVMSVPGKDYIEFILEQEEASADMSKVEVPARLLLPWKTEKAMVVERESRLNAWWFGTFAPNRKEMLWPRLRKGPEWTVWMMETITFLVIVNLGVVFHQILLNPLIMENTTVIMMVLVSASISLAFTTNVLAPFISDWALAARTDNMTDQRTLHKAVPMMKEYFGDGGVQDALGALSLHYVYMESLANAESTRNKYATLYMVVFNEKEQEFVAEGFETCADDPYNGLNQEATEKLLRIIGYTKFEVGKWAPMFQIRREGFLSLVEFQALVGARHAATNDVMTFDALSKVLIGLADEGEEGQTPTDLSVKKLGEVYRTIGMAEDQAEKLARTLIEKCNRNKSVTVGEEPPSKDGSWKAFGTLRPRDETEKDTPEPDPMTFIKEELGVDRPTDRVEAKLLADFLYFNQFSRAV